MRISDWSSYVCSSDLDRNPRDPLLKPEAERRGEGAVEDRDRARCAAEQDRLGKRAIDRRLKAFDRPGRMIRRGRHAISAPPPKLKKDRKDRKSTRLNSSH